MKTSMLGKNHRRALVAAWPEVTVRGIVDGDGNSLFPGDLVRLPAGVRLGTGGDWDVPGTVTGFAVGKDGTPAVVVHAPAWNGHAMDSWLAWIVEGDACHKTDESETPELLARPEGKLTAGKVLASIVNSDTRASISQTWLQLMVGGVTTKAGVSIRPGDLVRLPRNVARNRGSQLHAAGTCIGLSVGLDGSPCVVVDAVGEDVPGLCRWRAWVVRGRECLVIDNREAWRLEGFYQRDGRPKHRAQKPKRRR